MAFTKYHQEIAPITVQHMLLVASWSASCSSASSTASSPGVAAGVGASSSAGVSGAAERRQARVRKSAEQRDGGATI